MKADGYIKSVHMRNYLHIVAAIAMLVMAGCVSRGHTLPDPIPPSAATPGEAASWGVLVGLSWITAPIGVAVLVASVWVPFLRSVGAVLFGIGLGLALLPWGLERYGDRIFVPAAVCVGIGLAISAAMLFYQWLGARAAKAKERARLEAVKAKLEYDAATEPNPTKRLKDQGGLVTLRRLTEPEYELRREWETKT